MSYSNQASSQSAYSNVQPIWKFCFLYIITYGFYEIPWSHKHWKFIKEREGLQINPWWRAIFLPFTLYWLAKKILLLAEEKRYRSKYSPAAIVAFYWLFRILSFSDTIVSYITFILSCLLLLTIVKAANSFWEKEQPNLPVRQNWTIGEVIWTVFGISFWILVIIASQMPENN